MKPEHDDVSRLAEWLQLTTGGESVNAIAKKIGVPQRTLANHVNKGRLEAGEIVAIARQYDANVIYALRDHGLITDDDISAIGPDVAGEQMTIHTLLAILKRRIEGLATLFDVVARDMDAEDWDSRELVAELLRQGRATIASDAEYEASLEESRRRFARILKADTQAAEKSVGTTPDDFDWDAEIARNLREREEAARILAAYDLAAQKDAPGQPTRYDEDEALANPGA
ncbi:MAG: hypothetical protein E6Z28_06140 [Actinomyces urogenitalis]|uniref:hypothetical protein n=1 Tax=Actinomyces urogenitalis TaxID=103621 RepID=UPI00290EFEC4|nr:hypothetical protein [Actinomyces urogenitalis]MDU5874596.1 hypothetical protein [Actinomyces urogenitalis]